MTRNAVWALSNLCRGKNPPPAFEKVQLSRSLFIFWLPRNKNVAELLFLQLLLDVCVFLVINVHCVCCAGVPLSASAVQASI